MRSAYALSYFRSLKLRGATWPAAHMLAVTWIKHKHISGFVSLYTAVNLGYAVVGILGTVLVRNLGRDWLSYVISLSSFLWYFLWWRFVEESLHPNRPKRDFAPNMSACVKTSLSDRETAIA
ncbi:hypothetical protein NQ315_005629 [Exocentrus adspersus]|uniref:Uncharacterized protein n=1 Tax=Exocentrus adspersus TaxID=1586481 RepID=A0AAV8V805_9CUCU|nr:hypothetical protein NQ315_005629 [Exocentrus adspersus]